MSEGESVKNEPASSSIAEESSPSQPSEEDGDNKNLFASVWVKIEVDEEEENEIGIKEEDSQAEISTTTTKQQEPKQRKAYKKREPRPKDLKCEQCDYVTGYKTSLKLHIMGHTYNKPYLCNQCDYKTKYTTSLKRHLLIQHECKNDETKIQQLPTYECPICPYTTHFKWNLNAHQRKHSLSKTFKCSLCSYSTAYKHNIQKHNKKHSKTDTTYFCDKCPFATKYEGHITRHLAKVHFEISAKASKCDSCSFTTKKRWRLNIHMNRSRQENPLKCGHCDFQSLYRCEYREHKLTHNNKSVDQKWMESIFKTDTNIEIRNVKYDFKNADQVNDNSALNEDKTESYEEIKTKLFDGTYYTLNSSENYNLSAELQNLSHQSEHEKNNHYLVDPSCDVEWSNIQVIESPDQERPFQCTTCNYRAKFKASVQRHYQRHHTNKNRPYKCVNCDFSTKTKDQIALHNKRSKSEEVLNCKACAFTTIFKCQYVMHEKVHYPFKCVYCEYTCKKKYDMQKHFTMVHLGNGLKCKYCDYKAVRKESILCHEALHTGVKPFQCQMCAYTSVRRSLLENHILRYHQVERSVLDESKIETLRRKDVLNVETLGNNSDHKEVLSKIYGHCQKLSGEENCDLFTKT